MNNVYDYDFTNAFELSDEDLTEVIGTGGIGGFGACGACGIGGFGIGPFISAFSNSAGLNLAFNMSFSAAPYINTSFLTAIY